MVYSLPLSILLDRHIFITLPGTLISLTVFRNMKISEENR